MKTIVKLPNTYPKGAVEVFFQEESKFEPILVGWFYGRPAILIRECFFEVTIWAEFNEYWHLATVYADAIIHE